MMTTQPVKAWKSDSVTAGKGSHINTPNHKYMKMQVRYIKNNMTNYDRKMHDITRDKRGW